MRRNFVANVSHEIRTPLTVLAGFVETLSDAAADRSRAQARAGADGDAGAAHAGPGGRPADAGAAGGQPAPAGRPLGGAWPSCWSAPRPTRWRCRRAGTSCTSIGGDDAQLAGNETELQSALSNLVINAVRYTPPGGRIDVQWAASDDGWGDAARQRHRHRHRARAPAAADRALLSRRRQPLARHRRHRAWACRSSSTWCSATAARSTSRASRARAPPSGCCCRRRACAASCAGACTPDAGSRGRVLTAEASARRVAPVDRGQVVAVGRPAFAGDARPALAAAGALRSAGSTRTR